MVFTSSSDTLESDRLKDVDDRVISAVESLASAGGRGGAATRMTVADVAARAGMELGTAEKQLVQLAALTEGVVEVSQEGDVVYRFPGNVRGVLRSRSLRASMREAFKAAYPLLMKVVRMSFGAFLFASIFVTFAAIAMVSSSSDRDSERSERSSYGGGGGGGFGMRLGIDVADLMFRQSMYNRYYGNGAQDDNDSAPGEGKMNFLSAVFSFVFGDGNPNVNLENTRFKWVAQLIRDNRGAVTAEQLAPFLDPPETFLRSIRQDPNPSDAAIIDESFVLPAVTRFGGHPEVTDTGEIVYVFPDLQTTTDGPASSSRILGDPNTKFLAENEYTFSGASGGQIVGAMVLGVVNLVGVSTLADLLSRRPPGADAGTLLVVIGAGLPLLVAYAWTFWVAPLTRLVYNWRANAGIRARNAARKESWRWLRSAAPALRRKLAAARDFVQRRRVIEEKDVVYSSETGVDVTQEKRWEDLKAESSGSDKAEDKSDSDTSDTRTTDDFRLRLENKDIDKMWDGLV